MKNIRKQTFTLEQYLKDMKAEKIRTDQECQRLSGQWNPNMVNELITSVLTDDYIPPIILGEETTSNGITRQWIIDGLQRSSTLSLFRYGNTKITKNLDEYMVTYQSKATDENGNIKRDEQGEIVWENVEFDIRNKTYEQLPEELKEIFNGYQMEVVIYQNCDTTKISKLVRKLNNCKPMNQAQRAFTYFDFENLNDLLTRLTESTEITSEIRGLFNRKNGYIFVATFKAFTELRREDKEFGEFLQWLITEGKDTEINGKTWTKLDIDRSTRDSGTVHGKLDYLTTLVKQYFTEVKNVA